MCPPQRDEKEHDRHGIEKSLHHQPTDIEEPRREDRYDGNQQSDGLFAADPFSQPSQQQARGEDPRRGIHAREPNARLDRGEGNCQQINLRGIRVLNPAAGVNGKEKRRASAELIGASVRNAIGVVSNGRFVDVETRWICCQAIDVENVKQSKAQREQNNSQPTKSVSVSRWRRRGSIDRNVRRLVHRVFRARVYFSLYASQRAALILR